MIQVRCTLGHADRAALAHAHTTGIFENHVLQDRTGLVHAITIKCGADSVFREVDPNPIAGRGFCLAGGEQNRRRFGAPGDKRAHTAVRRAYGHRMAFPKTQLNTGLNRQGCSVADQNRAIQNIRAFRQGPLRVLRDRAWVAPRLQDHLPTSRIVGLVVDLSLNGHRVVDAPDAFLSVIRAIPENPASIDTASSVVSGLIVVVQIISAVITNLVVDLLIRITEERPPKAIVHVDTAGEAVGRTVPGNLRVRHVTEAVVTLLLCTAAVADMNPAAFEFATVPRDRVRCQTPSLASGKQDPATGAVYRIIHRMIRGVIRNRIRCQVPVVAVVRIDTTAGKACNIPRYDVLVKETIIGNVALIQA